MNTPTVALWSSVPLPRLRASRDIHTGEIAFPPLPVDSPLAARHATIELESEGTVYSYTVIHPAKKSGETPYALGYVDLPGPVRIFGRLHGSGASTIGARCVARPDDAYGYVFDCQDVQGAAA